MTTVGLACVDCGEATPLDEPGGTCANCGGQLEPEYDTDAIDADRLRATAPATALWDYDQLLPFDADAAVTLGEGATPLVDCPEIADDLDVESVHVKDEGHNPTGTVADRELAVAVTAAAERGATDLALHSTGADAVAAAAYGARPGLDVHAFVPARSSHGAKAMINVHDGDMTVAGGRLPETIEAYESAITDEPEWTPLVPGATPLRVAGAATALLEVFAERDWTAPDAVVVPASHGVEVVGAHLAARTATDLGLLDAVPALHAIQPEGCAPIVRAASAETVGVEPWDQPDTIAGDLEVPDPALGERAVAAVRSSGGSAVAVEDDAILESACTLAAAEGLQASVAGGAAAAGAWALAEADTIGPSDTVVVLNTGAGALDSDVLRSHLMGQGI